MDVDNKENNISLSIGKVDSLKKEQSASTNLQHHTNTTSTMNEEKTMIQNPSLQNCNQNQSHNGISTNLQQVINSDANRINQDVSLQVHNHNISHCGGSTLRNKHSMEQHLLRVILYY